MLSRIGIAFILLAFTVTPAETSKRIPDLFWLTANDGSLLGAVYADFNLPHVAVSGIYRDTAGKSPMKPRARAMFGESLMNQGDFEGAIREYGAVLQFSFRGGLSEHEASMARLNAQTNIGQILMMSEREAEAEKFLREAWLETPGFPAFGVGLSYFNISSGRLDEARAILEDAIAMMPNYPSTEAFFGGKLYLNRAIVKQLSGDSAGSLDDLMRACRYPEIAETDNCPSKGKP